MVEVVTSVALGRWPKADLTERFARPCRCGELEEDVATAADATHWSSSIKHRIGSGDSGRTIG